MVNHFRERMPQPIFGIAYSMGAAQLYAAYSLAARTMANLHQVFSYL